MKHAASGIRGVFWRANPQGSQERRLPEGRQRGDWWIRYACALGHRPPHWEKVGPKSLARETVEQQRLQVRQQGFCPKQLAGSKLTISAVLAAVVDDYEVNGRSAIGEVRRHEKRLSVHFGPSRDAATLTATEIDAYSEGRRKNGVAVATVNQELACLRRALRLAHQKGRLHTIPHVATAAEHNIRTGFFEEPEFRRLIDVAEPDSRTLFTFLYLTGWRTSEARRLEWRQIDFAARIARLEPGTTKNRDGRTFPFAVLPELAAVLREQRERTRQVERQTGRIVPLVFHQQGEPIGKKALRLAWKRAVKAAELADRIPHDFRRTAVRNLERAGVPRSVAMKLTGHRTESVFRRAIVAESDLAEGVAKLASLRERDGRRVVALGAAVQSSRQ